MLSAIWVSRPGCGGVTVGRPGIELLMLSFGWRTFCLRVERLCSISRSKSGHTSNTFGRYRARRLGSRSKRGGGSVLHRGYLKQLSVEIRDWEETFPDEVQRRLPPLERNTGLAVVRHPAIGGAPIVDDFHIDSSEALRQLVAWERWPLSHEGDTLLLAYSGKVDTINTTHAVYLLGSRVGVPLERWMSKWTGKQ